MRKVLILTLLAVFALFIAGCGGGDSTLGTSNQNTNPLNPDPIVGGDGSLSFSVNWPELDGSATDLSGSLIYTTVKQIKLDLYSGTDTTTPVKTVVVNRTTETTTTVAITIAAGTYTLDIAGLDAGGVTISHRRTVAIVTNGATTNITARLGVSIVGSTFSLQPAVTYANPGDTIYWTNNGSANCRLSIAGNLQAVIPVFDPNKSTADNEWGYTFTAGATNGFPYQVFNEAGSAQIGAAGTVYVQLSTQQTYTYNKGFSTGTFVMNPGGTNRVSLTVDSTGNIYALLRAEKLIEKYNSSGQYITTITNPSSAFIVPAGIAVDSTGNMYVSESCETANAAKGKVHILGPTGSYSSTLIPGATVYGTGNNAVSISCDGTSLYLLAGNTNAGVGSTLIFSAPAGTNTWTQKFSGANGNVDLDPYTPFAVDGSGYFYVAGNFISDGATNRELAIISNAGTIINNSAFNSTASTKWITGIATSGNALSGKVYISAVNGANFDIFSGTATNGVVTVAGGNLTTQPHPNASGLVFYNNTLYGSYYDAASTGYVGVKAYNTGTNSMTYQWPFFGGTFGASIWGKFATKIDSNGNIYVLDSANARVVKLDSSGKYLPKADALTGGVYAGFDTNYASYSATAGGFTDFDVDNTGNIYVLGKTNFLAKFNGTTSQMEAGYPVTTTSAAANKIAVDPSASGTFYVLGDTASAANVLEKYNGLTRVNSISSGNGWPQTVTVSVPDITVDSSGNVYYMDTAVQNRIYKFNSAGVTQNPVALATGLGAAPLNLVVDDAGYFYVTTTTDVFKYAPGGAFISRSKQNPGGWAGTYTYGSLVDVFVNPSGSNVYVTDGLGTGTARLFKFIGN